MGSFSISCGVSGQVIAEGDKCWAIPLQQESTFDAVEMTIEGKDFSHYGIANSVCYPDCFWMPMAGFVSGTYADYGFMDPDDTPTNRSAMAAFFFKLYRKAPIIKQGKNTAHDLPFDIKTFIDENATSLANAFEGLQWFSHVRNPQELSFSELLAVWTYVWDVAQESRLFLYSRDRVRPVQFGAFHHLTFNHLVTYASNLKDWNNQSYELSALLRRELDEVAKKVDLAVAGSDIDEAERRGLECFHRMNIREHLRLNMTGGVHGVSESHLGDQLELLNKHLDEGMPFDEFVEAMRPTMVGVYALAGLNALNLKFSPIVYAGQDYDNSQGKALAKFISTVSKEVSKERKKRFAE